MNEPTSPTAPLAAFPPQPEEYRSRAPEFYGFVAWSSTYLLFVLFILWGFLPDEWIVWSGVTWYPNRYFRRPALHSGFYLRSDAGNGRCCFQRGRWSSCSSPIPPTSLWLCLPPPPSRISPQSPVCANSRPPSLSSNPPVQTPPAVSSTPPHVTLQTSARPRRCTTSQSRSSITPYTIEGDGKKEICIYCVGTVRSTQCDATWRNKLRETKERAPDR